MGLFDLLGRHLLHHFLLGNGRIGVSSDGGEDVPHVGPHQIGRGHPASDLVVPPHARLRAGMPLHRRAKVPLERSLVVPLDAEPQRVHDADEFLRLGIARDRGGYQLFHRLLEATRIHQVARRFDLRRRRTRQHQRCRKDRLPHLSALLIAPLAARADGLPPPLQDDDFTPVSLEQAELGRLLFHDKILSGNRNISCGTCHAIEHGTSDGLSLGVGEGGTGVGPNRSAGEGPDRIRKRIPRNAQALWNLGATEIRVMFHDGRLTPADHYGNGFDNPAQEWLPHGLSGILAAQALFPLASQFEMAGDPRENEAAGRAYERIDYIWPILAKRVRIIPDYGERFVAAFDDVETSEDVSIVHVANALAAFQAYEYRSDDSPFDAYLRGDETALSDPQRRGLDLFFGKAGCASCHSGPLLTDQEFHALALPFFGPGRTRQWDPIRRDVGRMGSSDRPEDAYRFRTPSLRNVALTAPYGHNGAYRTLEAMIRQHLDPPRARAAWTLQTAALPEAPWLAAVDAAIGQDGLETARHARARDIALPPLSDSDIARLVAFLHALTGETAGARPLGRPDAVPSGLPVD